VEGTVALVISPPSIGGPTTLVLERQAESPHEPDFVADAPLVGFDAFLPDLRVFGWVRLEAARITDILNQHAELILVNVQVERLADGRVEWLEQVCLERDNLLAVRAGGPRGDPSLRQRSRLHPLVVQSGPFLIGGYLHARIGVDPFEEIDHRPQMVPLSTGWLEHWFDGRRHRQWAGTIVFNRALVDAIELVGEGGLEFGLASYPIHPETPGPASPGSAVADARPFEP